VVDTNLALKEAAAALPAPADFSVNAPAVKRATIKQTATVPAMGGLIFLLISSTLTSVRRVDASI
jgi:hypothetical protein